DRGEEAVRGAQRVRELRSAQGAVVRIEACVEVPRQLLLHRAWEPPRDHDHGAGGPPRAHPCTITGRDGCWRSAPTTVAPSSAGLGATIRPADRMTSAFSAAVSPNAEMIAPACPMRRPLGAVRPAPMMPAQFGPMSVVRRSLAYRQR